ncbi:tetratricopeptide repeat protein [Limnoglobus roseus]|uniref:Tetratricopeptide repeat protein n=1 Tax=Limnoglobus roseus TaxID=2598579 RepID=A0A5C1A8P1_9BACT|nr:tetratricopeptide repeat protein [Limnoglobus roseus]QEL14376.1 tetratricopeptide repeat protein [Limnoglobus roseus]
MTLSRRLLAVGSLAVLSAGSGCLHTPFGDIKVPKSMGGTATSSSNANTITPPTEGNLTGKQAATLSTTLAEQLEKEGKERDAITYYEKARDSDPANALKASRRLAVLYDRAGDSNKAMHEFRELLAARPKDADLHNDVGYSCYNRGEYADAETYLRKAVDLDKHHKRAWVNLGMTLAQLDRPADSLAAFEKAVTPAEAKSNLAFVLATKGNREGATNYYRQALAADSSLKMAQAGLAAVEKNQKPEPPAVIAAPVEAPRPNAEAPAFVVPPPPVPATGE